ncbi:MAG: FAD-dependent 5-carboxymethylaminomethyl-2-thiouridine(34) oxidoreductase MnmC [Ramlibacter sp.]|nr:FAD-dependent 5-carboxymethylaminomethyl-2-thiouridine(34) oxidoreductase MnmC [Ramlibacter sp.]
MAEAVEWLPDGTPRSPRFDDIYRSSTGGLEQARHVFLRGCGLPQAWAGRPQWRILETGFGLGLNFLAAWRAWKDDPQRSRILHFATVEAWPVAAADLVRSATPYPELAPLAEELAAQWFGLLPGVHRLSFEQGCVLLTLFVGDVRGGLRQEAFQADSIFLDGFDPPRNPAMWELATLKAVARHSRRGTAIATWTVAGDIRRDLAQCGFAVEKAEGLPPKRQCLKGSYAPAWEPKGLRPANTVEAGHCVVIGGGLAGAAAAASLARRGWQVTVLDADAKPAAGASGLPVGLVAPHFSPDDNLLSRLSRCGVRATFQQARALLPEGEEWHATGVLEHRVGETIAPFESLEATRPWTRQAALHELESALLDPSMVTLWHEQGGWIKPTALVRAWLAQTGVTWRGNVKVQRLERTGDGWAVIDSHSHETARAGLVVVAAAHASAALLGPALPLQPVRGQVSWAAETGEALPPFPVNGDGHFIPHVPTSQGAAWFCGSTFDRDQVDRAPRDDDHRANQARLRRLLPDVERQLAPAFASGLLQVWTGVRCASADRRPLLGEVEPGLWVSTAMGSRGLTFAALCAELLAARVHGEPLPLERRLAKALDLARLKR